MNISTKPRYPFLAFFGTFSQEIGRNQSTKMILNSSLFIVTCSFFDFAYQKYFLYDTSVPLSAFENWYGDGTSQPFF